MTLRLAKAGDEVGAKVALTAIHAKFPAMLQFLNNDDDGVSEEVIPFASQYVGILKVCWGWVSEDDGVKV